MKIDSNLNVPGLDHTHHLAPALLWIDLQGDISTPAIPILIEGLRAAVTGGDRHQIQERTRPHLITIKIESFSQIGIHFHEIQIEIHHYAILLEDHGLDPKVISTLQAALEATVLAMGIEVILGIGVISEVAEVVVAEEVAGEMRVETAIGIEIEIESVAEK